MSRLGRWEPATPRSASTGWSRSPRSSSSRTATRSRSTPATWTRSSRCSRPMSGSAVTRPGDDALKAWFTTHHERDAHHDPPHREPRRRLRRRRPRARDRLLPRPARPARPGHVGDRRPPVLGHLRTVRRRVVLRAAPLPPLVHLSTRSSGRRTARASRRASDALSTAQLPEAFDSWRRFWDDGRRGA